MDSHNLMFELSHPERLNILHLLKEEPMRLSQLSQKLKITTAEVSRHLDRLGKARLIDRNSESNYNVTLFANIILSEVAKFDFLTEYSDYFLDHDFSQVPENFHWFNSLAKGHIVDSTLEVMSLIKEASVEAKKFVHIISEEVMRILVDIDCKKHDEGVIFKKIYPKDAKIPREYEDRLGETFEIRTLEEIPLGLKITEKTAGIALRNLNGKIDYGMGFTGEDESFLRWTGAIFDYYWEKAKPML